MNRLLHLIKHPFWRGDEELHWCDQDCAEGYIRELWLCEHPDTIELVDHKIPKSRHPLMSAEMFRRYLGQVWAHFHDKLRVDTARFSNEAHVKFVAQNRVEWDLQAPYKTSGQAVRDLQETRTDWRAVGQRWLTQRDWVHTLNCTIRSHERWRQ